MTHIALGMGCSHTPLLTLADEHWGQRAQADMHNPALNMSDGRRLSYAQLLAEVGPRYADLCTPPVLAAKARQCQAALDRLADALAAAQPDVLLIIGDDQRELFASSHQPALAIFHGPEIVTSAHFGGEGVPAWMQQMGQGYLMDQAHVLAGASELAAQLIEGLMDEHFDIAALDAMPPQGGFGHAFGFVVQRLLRGRRLPVLPLLINTYYRPNVPSAARCYDLGLALRRVLQRCPGDQHVALVASGGLSHFVVDEALDRGVLQALRDEDAQALRATARAALNSGSSEILNWLVLGGAMAGTPLDYADYVSLVRTPAGTGVGAAFALWGGV